MGPDTSVYLDGAGGFCRSNLTDKTSWMHNLTKAANVRNYSPIGVIAAPFDPAGFVGPSGSESAPADGRSYTVRGADLLLSVAGGQGGRVVLRDGEGRPFVETEAALVGQLLPVGCVLSFEGFAAPPRVVVAGA